MKTISPLLISLFFFLHPLQSQNINLDFPSVNGNVYALAVEGNTLFIGGDFIEVNEIPRKNLAAIDLNTGELLDWSPEADKEVDCITVANNIVYFCGGFESIDGTPRNTLAAVNATDGALVSWNPDIVFPGIPGMQTGRVGGIAVYEDVIYIGGYFLSVNGSGRPNLAALDLQGNLLPWNPATDIPLERLASNDNMLYISGPFMGVEGQERLSYASFDLDTGELRDWNPMANNPGNSSAIVFPQDDAVFIAGFFDNVGGMARERAAKVDANSGDVLPWEVDFADAFPSVSSFATWGDRLFMGGDYFIDNNGNIVSYLTEVDMETGAYAGWWPIINDEVNALLVANNKLIVGGDFTNVNNEAKAGLAVFDFDIIDAVEELSDYEVSVFPKPASNELNIRLSTDLVAKLELYDMNGVLLKNKNIGGFDSYTLAIEDIPTGIYNLVFRAENHQVLKTTSFPVVK